MAARKKMGGRSPLNKERADRESVRSVGFRVSLEYAKWLEKVAKMDRVTIAGYLDRAASDRAKAIGFSDPPPERIPPPGRKGGD